MKKRLSLPLNPHRRSVLAGITAFSIAGILTATGCNNFIKRGQSPDDEDELSQFVDKSPVGPKYISETCGMWGMDYAKIEGIGLVLNLDGTGSAAKPGAYRDHLLDELKTHKDKLDNPRELFESKDTEMVIVRGYVPPGARKGDSFDVEIQMVPNMEGTSLDDGTVFRTRLRRLAQFKGRRLKEGLVVGLAEGAILVDSVFESRQDEANELHGWILGGGETLEYRPLGLNLRTQTYGPKTTTLISRAVNARFTSLTENGREGIAQPKNYKTVNLELPDIYRHNVRRFSEVMANIRYNETSQQRVERLDELGKQMTDPATCAQAALRLEAIGRDAVPTLKRSLTNPDLELRFRAAEALTYCGHSEGLLILKEVAETEPAFRWHAMTALSACEDSDAATYLELLMQSESAETRYGAFRALHTRSPDHPLVYGRKFKDFFLHSVPVESSPMVHFSRSKRPEVVVFGDARVSDDFLYVETGTTIRSAGTGKLKLIHYSKDHGREETVCSTEIGDLIETLANHDFTYGRILKIFRGAKKDETMVARLVVDAIPGNDREYTEDDTVSEESNRYLAESAPEMFRNGSEMEDKRPARVTTDLIDGNLPTAEELQEQKSAWTKMKEFVTGSPSQP
ncbi:flagellar basal body P-ring protein FlgI [Mariniblastus fucicola]|uniref:Flagellar basal body P-ring protein n=1 Tax=Mariniblastus fucicola TaxID=980251 RepID=A0A5B9P7U0_9BACT|nr:flagellar basal body P-ring protein FlgI [Mariniblastus fucicola]QEG21579.1 flagellar basal body P-ring protein [Mariniblastus fucicola]